MSFRRAAQRRMADAARRFFRRSALVEAGGGGRRWGHAGLRAPARDLLSRRSVAGARAAAFVVNSPYGAAVLAAWTNNLVADGPSVRPITRDKTLKADLIAAWSLWWDRCDGDGISDLGGFLQRVARSEFIFGEAFVHLSVDRDTGELRLRLLSPDQVDAMLDRQLDTGHRIVAGIEFDTAGRRVAYHIRENGDAPYGVGATTRRVPAEDVLHLFEATFPGQVRGISRLAPVATRLAEVDRLEDALLAKANTAALFGGVFYRPDSDGGTGPFKATQDNLGDYSLEPGAMMVAPPGYSVEFTDPPSTEGAVDFLRSQIRSVAAGVGLPYELVAADLSQVNYSSARLGLLEFRRRIGALQRNLIVARLLQPVWRRWLLLEALAGHLPMGVALSTGAEFVFPGWSQIDPLKETEADAAAIAAGIRSRFEVISARGRDPETVDAEIAEDRHVPTPAPKLREETAA